MTARAVSKLALSLPVYLDADVQAYLAKIAAKKGVPLSELANVAGPRS